MHYFQEHCQTVFHAMLCLPLFSSQQCKCYQPWPSARLITLTSTLIIPDITKTSSINCFLPVKSIGCSSIICGKDYNGILQHSATGKSRPYFSDRVIQGCYHGCVLPSLWTFDKAKFLKRMTKTKRRGREVQFYDVDVDCRNARS